MSLIYDEKVNRIYNHQRSVEERQPGKPVSEMGKIREKHYAEERKLGQRHDKEWDALKMKHQEIKNQDSDMKVRQRLEKERAIKAGHGAK